MATEYTCKKCSWSGKVNGRPRCLPCYARAAREWKNANREKYRAKRRASEKLFKINNRDEYNRKRRIRRSKARMAEAWARRREWLMAGTVTRDQLIEISRNADGKCAYCGQSVKTIRYSPSEPRGFDHIVPRSRGGLHEASNLVVCCGPCNAKKRDLI